MSKYDSNSALTRFQQCILNGAKEKLTKKQIFESQKEYGIDNPGKFTSFTSKMSSEFRLLENIRTTWKNPANDQVLNGVGVAKVLNEDVRRVHKACEDNNWELVNKFKLPRPSDQGTRGRKAAEQQDFTALATELNAFLVAPEEQEEQTEE